MEDKECQGTSGLVEMWWEPEPPIKRIFPWHIVLYAIAAVLLVLSQLIGKLQ